jgi:hypothetical protein
MLAVWYACAGKGIKNEQGMDMKNSRVKGAGNMPPH